MLLPQYWLRQQRLQRALLDYPIYDPPHKSEERILPKDQALENFQYFLDVRLDRVEFFNNWLSSHFGVKAGLDQKGIENTLDWAENYVGIILPLDIRKTAEVFFCYELPWTGDYAGANPLFDLAATLGEAIIRLRPELRWRMEWSLSDFLGVESALPRETMAMLRCRERDIREMKRDKWSGYRRPLLASHDDPIKLESTLGYVENYQGLMSQSVTVASAFAEMQRPKKMRIFPLNRDSLRNRWIKAIAK